MTRNERLEVTEVEEVREREDDERARRIIEMGSKQRGVGDDSSEPL